MKSSNYEQLMEMMLNMEVIDSHEHLCPEKVRLAQTPNFTTLFCHYAQSDLVAAGLRGEDLKTVFGAGSTIEEKWSAFQPYYDRVRDGSYSRSAHIAMEKFYGVSELNSLADAERVTKAIQKANKPGLYKKVLKDACKIRVSMNYGNITDDREFFQPVIYGMDYIQATRDTIRGLENEMDVACGNLTAYVDAVWEKYRQLKEQGMKGIKIGIAYQRDLNFAARTHAEAEEVFLRITEEGYGWRNTNLGYEEMRPFHDYMVHRFCEIAGELDIPIVFHTGLQTNHDHNADDSRPLRLWNLPHRYRRTDFVILHSGFPWLEDGALLAKQYRNVYLDLAWTHIMSPEIVTRSLQSIVDLVPMHKVIGFGGDYCIIEKVYGHLMIAKQDIARAFSTKIDNGGMTLPRAKAWAQAMLWDNPVNVFRLEF